MQGPYQTASGQRRRRSEVILLRQEQCDVEHRARRSVIYAKHLEDVSAFYERRTGRDGVRWHGLGTSLARAANEGPKHLRPGG